MACEQTLSVASRPAINVMFLCDEWKSSEGGVSTFNREFAVNLAKTTSGSIKVYCYVSQSNKLSREDARRHGVELITARNIPGSVDPLDLLKIPPPELPNPDIVVGHGRKFGTPAYFIVQTAKCKWIHFVHVFCEDLGKFKATQSAAVDTIEENEKKHKSEIELCKAADVVVAVGSRLQQKYSNCLPHVKVEIITPGIFEKFLNESSQLVKDKLHVVKKKFSVFMFRRASFEDLTLKGYDIVADAIGSLGKLFELTFVGSSLGERKLIKQWFLDNTSISHNQITIHGYCNEQDELKMMYYASVIIVLPSRTEDFGLVALKAISAGIPVLVAGETGIAEVLLEVEGGKSVIVESDDPEEWARRIHLLSRQSQAERENSAKLLRENYNKTYSWSNECKRFKRMIEDLVESLNALKLSIDVENMTPAEHNTQDRTLVSASQDGGPQETSAIPVSSGHTQSSCTVAEAPQTPMSPIPTEGEVLRLIAPNYLLNAPPSCKADHDGFLEYMKSMRGFIAGVDRGCLPIKDPAGDPLKILFEPVEEEEEEEEEHDDVTETVRQLKSDIKKLKKWKIKGELSDEGPDTKSESKIKAELSDEGPDTKSERNIEAELSDEGLDTKSKSKIKAKVSGEGSDTKSERKIKAELSDEGPDTKSERKIKGELSDEGPDTESERKIKAELSDEGLDTKSKSKIKAELSDEGPDTKSERKIKAKLSDEGPDTKSESRVKIDLLQKTLGTKSEKCEINRLGVVWKPQGIQAAACITFPPNAVTQPVLFICTLLEDPMHYPPLKKDEALVSDVIELSYDDPHGSNFTGDFGEMVSVALPHSATNLRGYEIVIRELVDSHNNDWRDLETTNTWQASGEVPFAEAKVMCCSSFAVVCRLKSYTYTPHALEDRDFTCTVEEYPDVIVTVPASVVRENKELQLTLKVQEIPRQWYEDSGVIVGPVLHITCSPEIQLFDPATITLPFSLQNNNECAKLSSGNVRVLVNSHEEDENETNPRADWEEITTQLPRPAALRNGVVTFQVTHFSWYTILWERSAERNRKRKRGAFQMTGRKSGALQMTRRKSPNFRITGRIPQAGCFFACLCTTNTEYLPLGEYCLHCFCCPLHVESRVKEIIRSTEGAILYGGGESSEPLCPDDVIHISLLKGLEADGHTTDDETQLRFRGDRHYSRYLMVEWTDKRRYTPKVDFHRCLDDQSQRSLYTCSIVISVGRMESQPVAVRDHTLTRKEAFNLSQELGSHWKSLGRQLEIDEHLLTKFHTENEELEEKAYQMLLYWKRKHASTATYDVLFKALCEVSRRDLAEKYCAANTNSL